MSGKPAATKTNTQRWGCGCLSVLGFVAFYVFMAIVWGPPRTYMIELPYRLAVGWLSHLPDLPSLPWKPSLEAIVATTIITVATTLAGHLIVSRRLHRWRLRDSVTTAGLVLLGTAAAIAIAGMGRQLPDLWSQEIARSNRESRIDLYGYRVSNDLQAFVKQHGHYPSRMEDLTTRSHYIYNRGPTPYEPYVLLFPGQSAPENSLRPVAISPVYPNGKRSKIMVIYSTGIWTEMDASDLDVILEEAREHDP